MDAFLSCKIQSGQFSQEVAVRGRTFDGTEFSLFVPRECVECEDPITNTAEVDGWLRVEVLDQNPTLLLVRLPGETFENGHIITVKRAQVQSAPRQAV